jgi:hypothetical protein
MSAAFFVAAFRLAGEIPARAQARPGFAAANSKSRKKVREACDLLETPAPTGE